MNNVILECPRCLVMFATSTYKTRQIGESLWGIRCRCGYVIEFDLHYMDQVDFKAQPHIADRIRKIDNYRVQVEGLTYAKVTS